MKGTTRYEIAHVLAVALAAPLLTVTRTFSDVTDSHEHRAPIRWASDPANFPHGKALFVGYGDGNFRPDKDLTVCAMARWRNCTSRKGNLYDNRVAPYCGALTDDSSLNSHMFAVAIWRGLAPWSSPFLTRDKDSYNVDRYNVFIYTTRHI